jgi:hypothetical protein
MATIKITITGVDKKLSDEISNSISDTKGYKYTYLKQLISRLRMIKGSISNLSEEEQTTEFTNVLIQERNIANFSGERYAELNNEELFNAFSEISESIEKILNE